MDKRDYFSRVTGSLYAPHMAQFLYYLNSFLEAADRVGGDQPREPDFQGEKVRLSSRCLGGGKEEEAVRPLGRARTICPLGRPHFHTGTLSL